MLEQFIQHPFIFQPKIYIRNSLQNAFENIVMQSQ